MSGLEAEYTGTNQNLPSSPVLNHESFHLLSINITAPFLYLPTSPSSIFQATSLATQKPKHNKSKNNTSTPTSQLCLTPVQLADEITCPQHGAAMSNVSPGKSQN
jgi:hypothetical protein